MVYFCSVSISYFELPQFGQVSLIFPFELLTLCFSLSSFLIVMYAATNPRKSNTTDGGIGSSPPQKCCTASCVSE